MTRGSLVNKVVALVAVAIAIVLAARAVTADEPRQPASQLVAAAVDGRAAVPDEPPVAPTTSSPPDTRAPATTVTTPPPPEITVPPTPTTASPVGGPGPVGIVPPVSIPPVAGPSSWSTAAEGITITARISPAIPKAGDTVTISWSTTGDGDSCCGTSVIVAGAIVGQTLPPLGTCPIAPVTAGSTTVVVSRPGPFSFEVWGTMMGRICVAPPSVPVSAHLFATFEVLPAA